ncbi:MAG: hypothetical protein AAB857_03025 [Patescibacteria group bacterium]
MHAIKKLIKGMPHAVDFLVRVNRGQGIGFSFNLSDRCPVGCDCYWRAMGRVKELSDEAIIRFFEARRDEGLKLVTIIGGEPYVRRGLLPKITPIMPANWLVTSGTTPLLHLPKTTHFVSIDGKDADTHDRVRKMPGLYVRILKNLTKARAEGKFPVFIHSVLNALNYWQVKEMLSLWRENGLVDGIAFSLVTRIRSDGYSDDLLLKREQRAEVIAELLRLKSEFGPFLAMSSAMIQHMHPSLTEAQSVKNCGTAQFVASYDASGERIPQCIFSDKGDCSQCGCVITPMVETLGNLGTIKLMAHLYTP